MPGNLQRPARFASRSAAALHSLRPSNERPDPTPVAVVLSLSLPSLRFNFFILPFICIFYSLPSCLRCCCHRCSYNRWRLHSTVAWLFACSQFSSLNVHQCWLAHNSKFNRKPQGICQTLVPARETSIAHVFARGRASAIHKRRATAVGYRYKYI